MCKAYTLTHSAEALSREFNLRKAEDFSARFNIRPTQEVPVITMGKSNELSFYFWGATPDFSKNKALSEKLFNIRAETLTDTVLHKKHLSDQRCLVPADGFYIWKQVSKKGLVPYRYFQQEHKLFCFAGLWQAFEDIRGKKSYTFSIITTSANELVAQADSRMPVILDKDARKLWLEGSTEQALTCLVPFSTDEMSGFAVSNRINDPAVDDPGLIKPAPPADQFGNYRLFD